MIRSRRDALAKLHAQMAAGRPLIGAGAGTGISAKFAEKGGVDLIVIYNSGRYRMAGRGSLAGLMAYGDANAIVMDMAREVLPIVTETSVLAGVNATDPFRIMDQFLDDVKRAGFTGVQNFPTVGLIDGRFRQNLEETGMGYELEVEMVGLAHEKDLLTAPYVFNPEEAMAMTRVGADIIVPHMGLTTKGSIGAHTALRIEDCSRVIQEIVDSARSIRREVIILCHGGPISEPSDAEYILQHTQGVDGFLGASSIERLATETAITDQARRFKSIRFAPHGASRPKSKAPPPRRPAAVAARSRNSKGSKSSKKKRR